MHKRLYTIEIPLKPSQRLQQGCRESAPARLALRKGCYAWLHASKCVFARRSPQQVSPLRNHSSLSPLDGGYPGGSRPDMRARACQWHCHVGTGPKRWLPHLDRVLVYVLVWRLSCLSTSVQRNVQTACLQLFWQRSRQVQSAGHSHESALLGPGLVLPVGHPLLARTMAAT